MKIRHYLKSDAADFIALVLGLADYAKLEPPSGAARRRLLADVGRRIHVLMAVEKGEAIGYSIYFFTYSSFLARPNLYLEDLFVVPQARGRGVGKAFMRALRREARRQCCGRMEWAVLRRNGPAIKFYDGLGAGPLDGWLTYRLNLRGS